MTVNTTNITSGPYAGNGVADTFSYTFRVTDKTQLKVFETTDLGVQTELAVDTDYTVNTVGDDAGGTITRVAGALPTGYEWYIRSDYDETQLTAFSSQGAFFPDLHENAMDKMTFLIQQLRDANARTLTLPDAYSGTLPIGIEAPLAGQFTRWSGDASTLENVEVLSSAVAVPGDQLLIFQSVAAMKASTSVLLVSGMNVMTQGYYTPNDGGGATYLVQTVAEHGGSPDTYGDHLLSGGNVAQLKKGPVVSIRQYGADPSLADNANYISAAVAGNSVIVSPEGDFKLSGITVSTGSKTIYADSWESRWLAIDDSSTVIDILASASEVTVRGIQFDTDDGLQRTGGDYINSAASDTYIEKCKMLRGFGGINFTGACSICDIYQCHFRSFDNSNQYAVIYIDTTGADHSIRECIFDNAPGATEPLAGIRLRAVQDIIISGCNIIHCRDDLLVDPATGSAVAALWATNTFFDTAYRGIVFSDGNGGNIFRCRFDSCWTSTHTASGVVIDGSGPGTIDGISFVDHKSHSNGSDGLSVIANSGTLNLSLTEGAMADNAGAAIGIGNAVANVFVHHAKLGPYGVLGGNAFGAFIGASCTNIDISDNRLSGNTSAMSHSSIGNSGVIIKSNVGYKTVNVGQATLLNGTTSLVVNHGLAVTPTLSEIGLTRLSGSGLSNDAWISTITSTQFTINVDIDPGSDIFFRWEASTETRGY